MNNHVILLQEEPRGPSMLIEIPVTIAGSQRVPIPDINQLRSTADQIIVIKGIRLVTVDVLTNGIINASANAPITELQKIALTIYAEGWEKGQSIPLLTANDMTVPGGTAPHRYQPIYLDNWRSVDWPKSYLQYANGTAAAGTPYVVMLDCFYVKINGQGTEITGPS